MDDDGTADIWKGLVQKINVSVWKNAIFTVAATMKVRVECSTM